MNHNDDSDTSSRGSKTSRSSRTSSKSGKKAEKKKNAEKNTDVDPKKYIKEKTEGYYIVKREHFGQLKSGDHIRYVGVDGKFRTGGFVWYKKTNENDGRTFWMLGQQKTPNMAEGVFRFALYWDKVKILWKKTDPETNLLVKSIDKKQTYINDIVYFLKSKFGKEFVDYMNSRETERMTREKNET